MTYLYFVGCWVKSHSVTSTEIHDQSSNTKVYAIHHKFMMLSHYMISAWIHSLFIRPLLQNIFQHKPMPTKHTQPPDPSKDLLQLTDEKFTPQISRTPLQNKVLLHTLKGLQAPRKRHKHVHFDSDAFNICIDIGASSTCSSSKDDFLPGTYTALHGATINCIASGLSVAGYGTVQWIFMDDNNTPIDVEIERVLHIPDLPTRLLSLQQDPVFFFRSVLLQFQLFFS